MGHVVTGLNFQQGFLEVLFLGPLLFNIFLNDTFLPTHAVMLMTILRAPSIKTYKSNLEASFAIIQRWLYKYYMFLNPGKYHYQLISICYKSNKINLNGTGIISSNDDKLLGVLIDKKLSFDVHIKSLLKKAGQKLSALPKLNS